MNYTSNIILHVPMLRYFAARASVILEIGLETGLGSTKAFAEGFAMNYGGRKWVGVDRNDCPNLPADTRFEFIKGDSTNQDTYEKIRRAIYGYGNPDLIFIDTRHTKEQIEKELPLCMSLADPRCTWVFHDTYMNEKYNDMTDSIKNFAGENEYVYLDLSTMNNGLGVMFK